MGHLVFTNDLSHPVYISSGQYKCVLAPGKKTPVDTCGRRFKFQQGGLTTYRWLASGAIHIGQGCLWSDGAGACKPLSDWSYEVTIKNKMKDRALVMIAGQKPFWLYPGQPQSRLIPIGGKIATFIADGYVLSTRICNGQLVLAGPKGEAGGLLSAKHGGRIKRWFNPKEEEAKARKEQMERWTEWRTIGQTINEWVAVGTNVKNLFTGSSSAGSSGNLAGLVTKLTLKKP